MHDDTNTKGAPAKDRLAKAGRTLLMMVMVAALCLPTAALTALAQTKQASASQDIYLERNSKISYGGYSTFNYHANVNGAWADLFCLEPEQGSPAAGSYATEPLYCAIPGSTQVDVENLARVFWYGSDGPGYCPEMWPEKYYDGTDLASNGYARYALTHILSADAFKANGIAALRGTTEAFQSWVYNNIMLFNSQTGSVNTNYTTEWCMFHDCYLDGTPVPADKRMPESFIGQCYTVQTGSSTQIMGGHYPGGYIDLVKASANPDITTGNACYDLGGAVYGIYNDAACTDLKETITTDASGYAKSGYCVWGTYYVKEISAPKGYFADTRTYDVTVTDGATQRVNGSTVTDIPANDPTFVMLTKYDGECEWSAANAAMGGASLQGAQYTVDYYDGAYDSVEAAEESGAPKRTWVFETNEMGFIEMNEADAHLVKGDLYWNYGRPTFPIGSYIVYESKAPAGYLLSESKHIIGVEQDGDSTKLTGEIFVRETNTYVGDAEQVKRGDLEFVKVKETNMARLAAVPFRLTSDTTGESHVIVTDGNGYASTANTWNAHSSDTNANDDVADGVYDDEAGIWFGLRPDGTMSRVDDEKGALPYDTYTLEEMPCAANEGLTLVKVPNITVKRDSVTVNMGTIDDRADQAPYIHTTATDAATGERTIPGDTQAVVNDHVEYMNLDTATVYTLKAELRYADNGEDVAGGKAENDFTPTAANGYVNMRIPADLLSAYGRSIVVFEYLYDGDTLVAEHADLADNEQMLSVMHPQIATTAVDTTDGDHEVMMSATAQITDTVSYRNLVAGESYRMDGFLMEKRYDDAGNAYPESVLDAEGNEVMVPVEFVAEESNGTVDVPFTVDTTVFVEGTELVVFEVCTKNGDVIAIHEDIDDEGQTVRVVAPSITTKATNAQTGSKEVYASPDTVIRDVVSYANILPKRTYEMKCTLMVVPAETEGSDAPAADVPDESEEGTDDDDESDDAEDATEGGIEMLHTTVVLDEDGLSVPSNTETASGAYPYLDADGFPEVVSVEFTPDGSWGEVTVDFPIDTSDLLGARLVCFEALYLDGEQIAEHADIDDEDQTVYVVEPAIGTEAYDPTDGDHEIMPSTEARITDIIHYDHLIPGTEYKVTGWLMDKASGKPLMIADKRVEATATFVANGVSGEATVEFTFDASKLAENTELVAFEELYLDTELVAEHKDIDDASQTVAVKTPPAGSGYDKTGGAWDALFGSLVLAGIYLMGIGAYHMYFRIRDGKDAAAAN